MLLFSYLSYVNNKILNRFLEKLDQKIKEEKQWKKIINEFHDGFLLLKKNCSILYKNMQINQIFGMNS